MPFLLSYLEIMLISLYNLIRKVLFLSMHPCSRMNLKLKRNRIHVNMVIREKVMQEVRNWERKRKRWRKK